LTGGAGQQSRTDRPGPARTLPPWAALWAARIEQLATRLLGVPRVATARDVLVHHDEVGGGLMARGLAFVAMFAIVPGLLLIISIAGLFLSDDASRERLASLLAGQFAPLAPVMRQAVDGALQSAPAFSIVGFVLLVWSASSFVRGLDTAVRQVFEEPPDPRALLRTVVEVVVVAAAFVALAIVLVLLVVPGPVAELYGAAPAARLSAIPLLAVLFALAYRFLPVPRPGWRVTLWPAAWIGLGVAVLTALFGGLGQLLTASTQFFGTFAAAFVGLIWLGWVAELFLLGAAWVRVRVVRQRGERLPG
jgi:membrane protein